MIEDLQTIGIADNSVDVVISNCVISLVEDKSKVFREVQRVLKRGGEFFFSDMYCDRRLPAVMRSDPFLWGEGVSGSFYIEDFRRAMDKANFKDQRFHKKEPMKICGKLMDACIAVGGVHELKLFAITTRSFKIDGLEDRRENYGQTAKYLGTIEDHDK